MGGEVIFGTSSISYSVVFSIRKTLGITVYPNGEVLLKAPINTEQQKLEEKLLKRASCILKQQRYFASFGKRTPSKRFVSGESHYY